MLPTFSTRRHQYPNATWLRYETGFSSTLESLHEKRGAGSVADEPFTAGSPYGHNSTERYALWVQDACVLIMFSIMANAVIISSVCHQHSPSSSGLLEKPQKHATQLKRRVPRTPQFSEGGDDACHATSHTYEKEEGCSSGGMPNKKHVGGRTTAADALEEQPSCCSIAQEDGTVCHSSTAKASCGCDPRASCLGAARNDAAASMAGMMDLQMKGSDGDAHRLLAGLQSAAQSARWKPPPHRDDAGSLAAARTPFFRMDAAAAVAVAAQLGSQQRHGAAAAAAGGEWKEALEAGRVRSSTDQHAAACMLLGMERRGKADSTGDSLPHYGRLLDRHMHGLQWI